MLAARLDRRLTAGIDPSGVVREGMLDAASGLDDRLRKRPLLFYPCPCPMRSYVSGRLCEEKLMNTVMRPVILGCGMGFLAVCLFGIRFACSLLDFREADRGAELEQLHRATQDRVEARWQMVQAVIAQQRTLADAIEQFRELYRQWPNYSLAASKAKAGITEDEWAYEHIAGIIKDILHDRPEQASAVLHRLSREYEKLRIERTASLLAATGQTEQGHLAQKHAGR